MQYVNGVKRNISWNRKTGGQAAKDIVQRAEADRQSGGGRADARRGPVTLTRAKLRNLGGYKSGYYRAVCWEPSAFIR